MIEKNVDPDMPLYRVQEIIEARREDLRKSLAKRMPRSRELTETVEILDYLNLTQEVLDNLTIHGMDPDTRIDVVLAKLKATLEDMENGVNEDEMKKRSENGKNKL